MLLQNLGAHLFQEFEGLGLGVTAETDPGDAEALAYYLYRTRCADFVAIGREHPVCGGHNKITIMNHDTAAEIRAADMIAVELDLRLGRVQIEMLAVVKPALSYLDIIYRIKTSFEVPVAAYNVSGEYVMLKSAINLRYLEDNVIYETLLSIKRAGADMVITYFAKDISAKLPYI